MKKITILLLGLFFAMCQCASCTAEETPEESTSTDIETQPSGTETTPDETMPDETAPAVTAPEQAAAEHIALVKYFSQQWEWDDEILLALSEYNGVTLYGDSIGKYPALSETLEQTKNMVVRSMGDEFDNLLTTAKEELDLLGADSFVTKESTLDVQIRRADSIAVSYLSDSTLVFGKINDRYLNGTTYNTETGKQLKITDVIRDISTAAELLSGIF